MAIDSESRRRSALNAWWMFEDQIDVGGGDENLARLNLWPFTLTVPGIDSESRRRSALNAWWMFEDQLQIDVAGGSETLARLNLWPFTLTGPGTPSAQKDPGEPFLDFSVELLTIIDRMKKLVLDLVARIESSRIDRDVK